VGETGERLNSSTNSTTTTNSDKSNEDYLVQTLRMVLPPGFMARRGPPPDGAGVLRASALGSGPKITFGFRHALRRVSIFLLRFSAAGLGGVEDKP